MFRKVEARVTPADFKTIRESLGLSAQWLATAVDVDQRTVRRWEDGALPLRADVVDLLTRLDEQMTADVAAEADRVLAGLGAGAGADPAAVLDTLAPADWPVLEIPRVDTDVTDERGLPASYHRAVAARVRRELAGRLHLTYAG
ncbi:antitoxin Xre-like helix-turn-helix domain-containing protein [Amycolatopsis sp. NPDC004378]